MEKESVGKGTFLKGGERRGEKHGLGVFLTADEWEVKTRRSEKRREEKVMWEVRRERKD